MNARRAARIGDRCDVHGMSRNNCPCAGCRTFRAELKAWNRRLAAEGHPVDRGTSQYTHQQHERRTAQSRKARRSPK